MKIIAIILALSCPCFGYSVDQTLDAIRQVETGGHRNPSEAVGDGGKAIGPYQIHREYWIDSRVSGKYEDCKDEKYARKVVLAYWQRYCPIAVQNGDAQIMSRIHNGGPRGHKNKATIGYWNKVKRVLDGEQR